MDNERSGIITTAKNFLHELEGRESRLLHGVFLVGTHEGAGHQFRQ